MIVLFEHFDAIATRRGVTAGSGHTRHALEQLLLGLESASTQPDLLTFAATDHFELLDPSVLRAGHFDLLLPVKHADAAGRAKIFESQLRGRPVSSNLDLGELARLSETLSAARIAGIVNRCALDALSSAGTGPGLPLITQSALETAIVAGAGHDRPTVGAWGWDDVILPDQTRRELQELQHLIEDPTRARCQKKQPVAEPVAAVIVCLRGPVRVTFRSNGTPGAHGGSGEGRPPGSERWRHPHPRRHADGV